MACEGLTWSKSVTVTLYFLNKIAAHSIVFLSEPFVSLFPFFTQHTKIKTIQQVFLLPSLCPPVSVSFCFMFIPHVSYCCLWPVGSKPPLLPSPLWDSVCACRFVYMCVACHLTAIHSCPPFMHVITNRPVGLLRHSSFMPGLKLNFHPPQSPPIIPLPPYPPYFPLLCPRPVSPVLVSPHLLSLPLLCPAAPKPGMREAVDGSLF